MSTLNTGKAWAYTVLLIVVAFFGKFIGCFFTAKLARFNTREAGAIGALMSCKGLVELIVLNVGLSAGILDTRLFSMFVVRVVSLIGLMLGDSPDCLCVYCSSWQSFSL